MRRVLRAAVLLGATGCYGFAGGALPGNPKTVAVVPFENETLSGELPRELSEALREGLEKRLGLKPASEEKADVILRGKIVKYDLDIPVAVTGGGGQSTSARRRLAISVDIELVTQANGKVIWQKTGMTAEGEYAERGEATGRKQAIERLVSDVIEGAQSNW